MRKILPIVLCFPLAAFAAPPASAPPAKSPPAVSVAACDVQLNVIDPDPKGLNVRSGPTASAPVVDVIRDDGDWSSVHVTGQQGDWMAIDRAETIDDRLSEGVRSALKRPGWVHVSRLGVSELATGSGTVLRDRPSRDGKVLSRIRPDDSAPTRILGCQGTFIHVRHGTQTGWTDTWCNDERTTCA